MTLRPGANLLRACVVLVAFTPLAFWRAEAMVVIGLAAIGLVIACVWDHGQARKCLAALEVRRSPPSVVGRGLCFSIAYSISNLSSYAVSGRFRDIRPQSARPNYVWCDFCVEPGGRIDIDESLRMPDRGEHRFGPVWVRAWGPWRLIETQRPLEDYASLRVLPETFVSREELIKDVGAEARLLDKVMTAQQKGSGTEFDSLYPYQYGDDPRRIDWRATARARQPIVRHYQVERHRDVMIVVDTGRLMAGDAGRGTKLDRAVDSALHLAGVALRGGDRCGVGVFDDRVRGYLPPVTGVASLRSIVDSLYDARTDWRESDFTRMFAELQARQAKRSLVIVLSDLSDQETSRQLRSSLARLSKRHLVLLAALRTPMLSETIASPIGSLTEGARKAIAMRLVRERRQTLHAIERSGVQVLDVEPKSLTLPLINRFLTLRSGRLL